MNSERDAAINFIKTCRETYPEIDLMDDVTKATYFKCWEIVRATKPKVVVIEPPEDEEILIKPKTPKKVGKLKRYEDDVLECLHQGYGEEKQLLDEAYNRKNVFARANYIKAYNRALARFQNGE